MPATVSGITTQEKKLISDYAQSEYRQSFSAFMIQSALKRIEQEKRDKETTLEKVRNWRQ